MGVVFAGVINTGINCKRQLRTFLFILNLADMLSPACWILLFLGANSEWKQKLKGEYESLIAEYATSTSKKDLLHTRLSSIPVSAGEEIGRAHV